MAAIRFRILLLIACGVVWPVASMAEGRGAPPDVLDIVEERRDLMLRMLDAVNRVAPRLGTADTVVNPSHWRPIRENLDAVETLLRKSRSMWPARSNLGWNAATRAMPGLWALPDAFGRHYDAANEAFPALREALSREDAAAARDGFCRLVAACGQCHAAFRKIDTASLYREGPHWLGRYPGCAYGP